MVRHPGGLLRIWGVISLLALPLYSPAFALPDRLISFLGIAPERLDAALTHLAEFVQRAGIWWAAVGWHRLVLRHEAPCAVAPRFRLVAWFDYVMRGALATPLAFAPVLIALLGLTLARDRLPQSVQSSLMAVPLFVGCWLALRLSPWVVGGALREHWTVVDAWAATRHMARPLAILAMAFTIGLLVWHAQGPLLQPGRAYDVSAGQGLMFWGLSFCLHVLIASLANAIHLCADWPSPSAPLPNT